MPKPIVVRVSKNTAVVVRLYTYRDIEKVYIQGGYEPADDFTGELMIDPTKEFPKGLCYGKAVTFTPDKFNAVCAAIMQFLALMKPTKTAPKPATNAPVKTKNRPVKLASNAVIQPADHIEDEDTTL